MEICRGCFKPTELSERLVADKSLPGLELMPTIDTGYCAHCRRVCEYCGDWMRNLPEMVVREDEKPIHAECMAEILREIYEPACPHCKGTGRYEDYNTCDYCTEGVRV